MLITGITRSKLEQPSERQTTPSGAPAAVTVNKPECSRQPSICVVECAKHGMTRDRPSAASFCWFFIRCQGNHVILETWLFLMLSSTSRTHEGPVLWSFVWVTPCEGSGTGPYDVREIIGSSSGLCGRESRNGINRSTGGHEYWQASGEIL